MDVVESVSVLISAKGQVLRSEISGAVKMRVYLTGMPELRLGLNDKVVFDSTGKSLLPLGPRAGVDDIFPFSFVQPPRVARQST